MADSGSSPPFDLDEAKVTALVESLVAKAEALGIHPLALPVHVAACEIVLALRLYPDVTDDELLAIRRSDHAALTIAGVARRYLAKVKI